MKTPDVTLVHTISDLEYETLISEIIGKIYSSEMKIDDTKPLYLITWAPNPALLPNADFEMQHDYNVNILADFCKTCDTALFCVESSQLGNPHYHGFYQPTNDRLCEKIRIAIVKTLQEFGLLKIDKSKGMYKRICYWTSHANCLYYYKKDVLDSCFGIPNNPVNKKSKTITNFADYAYMFKQPGVKATSKEILQQMTLRDHYRQFYEGKDLWETYIKL